jgi:uncharacterized protein (TIGR01244 family)
VGRPGIENFDTVATAPKAIYRGAQPTEEGVGTLAREFKVRTVIDLRNDAEPWERAAVERAGMTYMNIPTRAYWIEEEKVREFVNAVAGAAPPIYVHCREGRDRTGLEIAVYRIVVEHRDRESVIAEMERHGYNWFWLPNIKHFVRTFDPAQYQPAAHAD